MQILTASEARAAFPTIVGDILGAEVFGDGTAIVQQGTRAYAAIVDGSDYIACCPTRGLAARAIAEWQAAR